MNESGAGEKRGAGAPARPLSPLQDHEFRPEHHRVSRAVRIGAAVGALGGLALVLLLHSLRGAPENFLPKAIAVVFLIAAFGAFVGVMISHARKGNAKADEA